LIVGSCGIFRKETTMKEPVCCHTKQYMQSSVGMMIGGLLLIGSLSSDRQEHLKMTPSIKKKELKNSKEL
jgi:hypothetical protein